MRRSLTAGKVILTINKKKLRGGALCSSQMKGKKIGEKR
jgi:hypothetical protein